MALAARQPGVITRGQMRRAGLTEASIRWRVGTGTLELVVTGVYRVAGATRSWEQRLAGACLWGGPAPALPTGPQGLSEVSTVLARERWKSRPRSRTGRGSLSRCIGPRSIRPWSRRSWGFRLRTPFAPCWTLSTWWMSTGPTSSSTRPSARASSPWRRSGDSCAGRAGRGRPRRSSRRRIRGPRRSSRRRIRGPGVGKLRRLLEQRDPACRPSASEFQAAVRALLVGAGLTFVEEYVVTDREGRFVARVDFLLDDAPVVIEADGRATHSSRLDWEHDLERRNGITAQGLAGIHAAKDRGWNQPDEVHAEIFQGRR